MESLGILRSLSRHPIGVAFGILLSAAVGLVALYDVSISPPGLQSRMAVQGFAQEHVLVDTPSSMLVDVDAPGAESIGTRSIILSNLLEDERATEAMARRAEINPDQIAVVGLGTPFPDLGTPLSERALEVVHPEAPYMAILTEGPSLPILSILVKAPRRSEASRLAAATTETLARIAGRAPAAGADLRIEQLGEGRAWSRATEPSRMKALAAALVVFVAWSAAVVAYDRLRRRRSREGWREDIRAWG
jgi:hypothetical protein